MENWGDKLNKLATPILLAMLSITVLIIIVTSSLKNVEVIDKCCQTCTDIIKEQEYQRQEIRKLDLRNEETRLFVNWMYRDLNGINDMPDNSPIFLPQIPVKYCDVCHFQPAQGAR